MSDWANVVGSQYEGGKLTGACVKIKLHLEQELRPWSKEPPPWQLNATSAGAYEILDK
jgi:hypothetical protein